jgi:hypothetical protein
MLNKVARTVAPHDTGLVHPTRPDLDVERNTSMLQSAASAARRCPRRNGAGIASEVTRVGIDCHGPASLGPKVTCKQHDFCDDNDYVYINLASHTAAQIVDCEMGRGIHVVASEEGGTANKEGDFLGVVAGEIYPLRSYTNTHWTFDFHQSRCGACGPAYAEILERSVGDRGRGGTRHRGWRADHLCFCTMDT